MFVPAVGSNINKGLQYRPCLGTPIHQTGEALGYYQDKQRYFRSQDFADTPYRWIDVVRWYTTHTTQASSLNL